MSLTLYRILTIRIFKDSFSRKKPPQTLKKFFLYLKSAHCLASGYAIFTWRASINPLSILPVLIDELCGLGFFLTSDFFQAQKAGPSVGRVWAASPTLGFSLCPQIIFYFFDIILI